MPLGSTAWRVQVYAVCAMPDDTAVLGPRLLPVLGLARRAMHVSQGRQARQRRCVLPGSTAWRVQVYAVCVMPDDTGMLGPLLPYALVPVQQVTCVLQGRPVRLR